MKKISCYNLSILIGLWKIFSQLECLKPAEHIFTVVIGATEAYAFYSSCNDMFSSCNDMFSSCNDMFSSVIFKRNFFWRAAL